MADASNTTNPSWARRPTTSNADEWQLWLQDHVGLQDETGNGCAFLAVQIVEAIEEHQRALAREVYGLAEDTAEKYEGTAKLDDVMGAFSRGRITEAKSIARAINAIMPLSRVPASNSLRSELQEMIRAAEAYAGRAYLLGRDQHVSHGLRRALDAARAALADGDA